MPELPDVVVYIEALEKRILGRRLERVRLASPFVLRTFDPPIREAEGRTVERLRRIGKRIAIGLEGDLWLVIHLMIAGRLQWKPPGSKPPGRRGLAAFDFAGGTLVLTEAGSKKRASLKLLRGPALGGEDRGGVEPLEIDAETFGERMRAKNRTLKRALTDPTILSGIGNAYSDEILHRARLSPVLLTGRLDDKQIRVLFEAVRTCLAEWTDRLRTECGDGFPEKVTAFRAEMAVHGKYGEPCPACGTAVRRIRYADNETNYCPGCQTGGRVLADRSLSRLLREDWPRTVEQWETEQ